MFTSRIVSSLSLCLLCSTPGVGWAEPTIRTGPALAVPMADPGNLDILIDCSDAENHAAEGWISFDFMAPHTASLHVDHDSTQSMADDVDIVLDVVVGGTIHVVLLEDVVLLPRILGSNVFVVESGSSWDWSMVDSVVAQIEHLEGPD